VIVPRNIYLKWRPAPVQPIKWIRTVQGVILAAGFAVLNGYQDVINLDIFDIPALEGLAAGSSSSRASSPSPF